MLVIILLSWLCVAAILASYASSRAVLFDWCNLLLCVPVALPAILLGAYSSAAISLCFGIIAAVTIVRRHRAGK